MSQPCEETRVIIDLSFQRYDRKMDDKISTQCDVLVLRSSVAISAKATSPPCPGREAARKGERGIEAVVLRDAGEGGERMEGRDG